MESDILKLLARKSYVPATADELRSQLKLSKSDRRPLQEALKSLELAGRIARIKGKRWILPLEADLIPGRIQITRKGRGFLLPDDPGLGELEIPTSATGTAMHDDHVLVRRDIVRGKEAKTGKVVRVLERRRSQLVGTFRKGKRFPSVIPDDPRLHREIYVELPRDVGRAARDGDKVVVELSKWESPHANPEGTIVEVLGPPTKEGVDMLSVLRQYDLPLKFPRKVLQEVKKFGSTVQESDLVGRTDCRKDPVITIDPADAKDFDDAFSLVRLKDGRWKLRVHIADVSHYVKPGTALDTEAQKRGNSSYLVDRVIPMLPEALSNELCSLKPGVDRLSKCVEFQISKAGEVIRSRCFAAVIHSYRRFSYEEALEVLRGSPNGILDEMLCAANGLAQIIRKRRFRNGSLALDFPESKIRLDEQGRVARIDRLENDESHQLIEEFMLLANEAVASRLMKQKTPTIYRVHEMPDPDRLRDYREDVLSHNVTCGNLEKPAEVQKLLARLDKLPIGAALKIGFLRSLMRARYAIEPLGHYGLAKKNYTHFTSPIRRYADLVVHRSVFGERKGQGNLRAVADHISSTERNSSDAERDSKSVKMMAYLEAQLKSRKPQIYEAMVTEVRNYGFFVDVPALAMSGLVPLSKLDDDFFEFDSTRLQIRGRRTGRIIKLGDRLEVVVAKVNSQQKQVDFRLAGSSRGSDQKRKRTSKKGAKKGTPNRGGPRKKSAAKKSARGPRSQSERQSSRPPRRKQKK